MESMDRLRELARAFRDAILRADRRDLVTLEEFPHGACGDASLLLGEFLTEHGYPHCMYESGWFVDGGQHQSHAWLDVDGIIVDITADQFDNVEEPVVVTRDRHGYDKFRNRDRSPARLQIWDAPTRAMLEKAYARVVRAIGHLDEEPP